MKQYNKLEDVVIKNKARQFTRSQIKKGLIVRGDCVVSGCDLTTEAHHEDYSKPLEIMWLCKAHHEQHHHGGINNLEINL